MKHFSSYSLSSEVVSRLQKHKELLEKWQEKTNLISSHTLPGSWERHFEDSIQLISYLPSGPATLIDLGSGAGFPGLVLALCCLENLKVALVESNLKKCIFLENVSRETFVPVDIIRSRIEEISSVEKDVITARGLAPLTQLCDYACPFMKRTSFCLFLKGKDVEKEIKLARKSWKFSLEIFPSLTDSKGSILKISQLERLPPHDKIYRRC